MKKILLLASLILSSQTIFAQLEKGMIAIGLTSNFSTTKRTDDATSPGFSNTSYVEKNTSYSLSPTISYFLSNRFALGIQVGYAGYQTINENTEYDLSINEKDYSYTKTTSNGTNISPYVKYYFPLSDQVYFLLKGSYSTTFSTGKTSGYNENTVYNVNGDVISITKSNEYGPNKTNTVDMIVGISPGMLFMPTKKIGLEFSLGNLIAYNSSIANTTNSIGGGTSKSTTSSLEFFNFNTLNIGTGIYYFF